MKSLFALVWASPWSFFGLFVGAAMLLCAGGHVQRTGRVIEFFGRGPAWFLRFFPFVAGASAVTFGHVVLAQNGEAMDACRAHELAHVRQYERWGLFFVPAYLLCWMVLTLRRRSGYWDNPFEREAYGRPP